MCIQGQQGATLQADETKNRHTTGSDVRSKTGRTQEVRGVACVQGKVWLLFVFITTRPSLPENDKHFNIFTQMSPCQCQRQTAIAPPSVRSSKKHFFVYCQKYESSILVFRNTLVYVHIPHFQSRKVRQVQATAT